MPETAAAALYSQFGDDPEMAVMVDLFVDEMPDRVDRLQFLMKHGQWNELGRFAHQLKGAAGSYGFDQLTPLAARLETAVCQAACDEEIHESLEDLIEACRRTRTGSPR